MLAWSKELRAFEDESAVEVELKVPCETLGVLADVLGLPVTGLPFRDKLIDGRLFCEVCGGGRGPVGCGDVLLFWSHDGY